MKKEDRVMGVIGNGTITIEFPIAGIAGSVEPKQMISLKSAYKISASSLMEMVKANVSKTIQLRIVRMDSHGEILKKDISGVVKSFTENSFNLFVGEDMDGTYEEGRLTTIRIDNPIGIIPLLPSTPINFNPCKLDSGKMRNFFNFLSKLRKPVMENVGKPHTATLFHYSGKGKYEKTKCEIVKVNRSNFEIKIFRVIKFDENRKVASIETHSSKNPIVKVKLHVTPRRYLYKVIIHPGVKYISSGIDDYGEK